MALFAPSRAICVRLSGHSRLAPGARYLGVAPPEEIIYIRRPVLVFDDPVFAFALPPPPPVIFLAPPPPEFVVLAPPPPPVGIFVLPMPIYRPVPVWVRPPAYVAPPPNNVIYNNVHNTVVVNNVTNTVTITNPSVPGWQDHGGRERSARLQVNQLARNSLF